MPKTTQEIVSEVHGRISATAKAFTRKDKSGKEFKGRVSRSDILEVLEAYRDPKKERENISAFLDSLEVGVLDYDAKQRILNDLHSYNVSYSRKND